MIGAILCSCERFLGTSEHEHSLHVEAKTANIGPFCASGWPQRHFTTIPYVKYAQRGVVSKVFLDEMSTTNPVGRSGQCFVPFSAAC